MDAQWSRAPSPAPTPDNGVSAKLWLPPHRRAGSGRPVVCFPPAGAGAGFFHTWGRRLPEWRLLPVQLPGREERFAEPAMDDARTIATMVTAALRSECVGPPILLGYSYGALLAFETARQMEAAAMAVAGVVACARAAPQIAPREGMGGRPDGELVDYIRSLGGLPPEILAAPDFLALLLPTLRADLRANDGYAAARHQCVRAPLTILAGREDKATRDGGALAWAPRAAGRFELHDLPGGHFFVLEHPRETFDTIASTLDRATGTAGQRDVPA